MDGAFHYINNEMSGQSKEESKYIDEMKDLLANNNGYVVIRIPCNGDINFIINNIKNSLFSSMYELNIVDFKSILIDLNDTTTNKVAILWNEGKCGKDISEILKLSMTTITKYLKLANQINLCNYSEHLNRSRGNRIHNNLKIKVICLNINTLFDSFLLASKYCKLKGSSSIVATCKNKRKTAGKHPITGEPLCWMYYDEFKALSKAEQQNLLNTYKSKEIESNL